MENKLFVGNLSWSVDDAALEALFAPYGEITSARVVTDRESGRSRGFGFVEFANEEDAKKALEALDQSEVDGRAINVSIARPKEA
ncbi:MAG: RNA-binding protein [Patescibacteria group bacterium]